MTPHILPTWVGREALDIINDVVTLFEVAGKDAVLHLPFEKLYGLMSQPADSTGNVTLYDAICERGINDNQFCPFLPEDGHEHKGRICGMVDGSLETTHLEWADAALMERRREELQRAAEKFYSWMSLDGRTSVLVLATSREDAIARCKRFFSTPKTAPVDGEDRALVVNMDVIQVDDVDDKLKPFADELRKSGRVALIGLAAVH